MNDIAICSMPVKISGFMTAKFTMPQFTAESTVAKSAKVEIYTAFHHLSVYGRFYCKTFENNHHKTCNEIHLSRIAGNSAVLFSVICATNVCRAFSFRIYTENDLELLPVKFGIKFTVIFTTNFRTSSLFRCNIVVR